MPILTANTIVHRDGQPVALSVGDVLPAWAEGLVGDHCLEAPAEVTDAPDEDENDDDTEFDTAESDAEDETQAPAEVTDAPDFTAPAPRQTRARRK